MSGLFVADPDGGRGQQHSGFRCSMARSGTILEEDLQKTMQSDEPGGSNSTMRPSTPPPTGSPGGAHQFVSPSGSVVTSNISPGSSTGGASPTSTAPTSAATSPANRSSEFKPATRQPSDSKHSSGTTQAASAPHVAFDIGSTLKSSSTSPQSPDPKINKKSPDGHFDLDSIRLRSLSPTRDSYYLPYARRSAIPSSYSEPPPLDLQAPTTFGPYRSPHTLSELHARAWFSAKKPFPIEPCLQCRLKGLPCPANRRSPCNAHLGPLLDPSNADDDTTAPRLFAAHPRFPACLRCIRAGEADSCIVQRRATLEERAAFRKIPKTFSEDFLLDTAVVILPTDRDVANPSLFAEKLRKREELLQQTRMKEEKAAFAPRQVVVRRRNMAEQEEVRIRDGQERDRLLLSGKGRKAVLKPTESWGEKWVGRREAEELEYMRKIRENTDEILAAAEAGGIWA
ncbi:tubulin polyglutamylase ttll6-like isoform x1 [Diplodia corticola]|uniref:Tubulin polyglutamylase ttll6-like isoform x1 n=1 Tax=Diplodia corticola TaxID=236234 RepID=A0A1J9RBP4_9PEZI|nr:tubulin polyglutamylase ttll6-like isoform x1 [Diplodia corticola]OJD39006.1 tubulin polyglutamylase ttll6-like isoform x1 [Diplodia corticola]